VSFTDTDVAADLASAGINLVVGDLRDADALARSVGNRAGNTGPIDASEPEGSVPDGGSTATLLGSVLLGLGMLRRRLRKN